MTLALTLLSLAIILQTFRAVALERRIKALESESQAAKERLNALAVSYQLLRQLIELQRLTTHRLTNLVHEGRQSTVTGKETLN